MAWFAVFTLLLVLLVVAAIAYTIALFNALIQVKHQVDQAWSNIDVLLKQRHDELPKLVDAARAYMDHEQGVLAKVTALRTRAATTGQGEERLETEAALTQGVTQLLAVTENYPLLRANEIFSSLLARITALEEQIAHRREYYNAAVNINNVRMEQFPEVLLSTMAGLVRRPLLESFVPAPGPENP